MTFFLLLISSIKFIPPPFNLVFPHCPLGIGNFVFLVIVPTNPFEWKGDLLPRKQLGLWQVPFTR